MDIVEQIFKSLNPETEESKAPEKATGEYITKEELENVVTKVTENIESKFAAMISKLTQPKTEGEHKEGVTQQTGGSEDETSKGENV